MTFLQDFSSLPPLSWRADNDGVCSSLWTAHLPQGALSGEISLTVKKDGETLSLGSVSVDRTLVTGSGLKNLEFRPEISAATRGVLEEELANCEELLELEPGSKWTNFTKAMLLKTMDARENFDEIVKTLEELKSIDSLRSKYYEDQISKLWIERALESSNGEFEVIDLSGRKLSRMFHSQYLQIYKTVKLL